MVCKRLAKLVERKETNLRCHSGRCSQPHPAMSAGIFLPSCHLEMRMPQPWGDCRSPSILEGWWSPPRFLLSGLEMGSPASQASPGPDNDEGSGPGSGVLGEERDGIRQGWWGQGDCLQKVVGVWVETLCADPNDLLQSFAWLGHSVFLK